MPDRLDFVEHSYEVEEIIGNVPPWLIRWGIMMFLFVFGIIILCSTIISFPSLLPSTVVIDSKNQPFRVSWLRDGAELYKSDIKDGQKVMPSDTLLVETNASGEITSVITAPVEGKAIVLKGAEDNPRKNTIIINPTLGNYEVRLYIKPERVGEVLPNQKVMINLAEYSAATFGPLEGKITEIIRIPVHDKYIAKVRLVDGLKTIKNKTIPLASTLTGDGYIELSKKNIFLRIFGSLFDRNG
jgi:hypothetical protein